MRVHHGGEVLAPGDPTDPIQLIDPHDLAAFVIKILEEDIDGTYNTVGPGSPLTTAEFLYGLRAVTTGAVTFTWVSADFLAERDVAAMTDLPIWFPPRDDYPTPASRSVRWRRRRATSSTSTSGETKTGRRRPGVSDCLSNGRPSCWRPGETGYGNSGGRARAATCG